MEILVVMAVGAVVGVTVFPERLKGVNEKLTLLFTVLLIFSMGVMLGKRDAFLEELGSLGLSSLLFCLLPVIFSVIVVYILTNLLMSDIIHKSVGSHVAAIQDSSPKHGETVMSVMAVSALLCGALYGLSGINFMFFNIIAQHSNAILFGLMFFVGISVGTNRGLLSKLCQYHVRVLIIPVGIVIGSIVGGFLAALFTGLSLPVGGAIASGLGWYSLSGVMLTEIAGAQVGSITFLSNLLRELVSFFSIPWIAKHLNYPTCIAPAGATSEDTTLPMLIRCTNGETVVLSVLNGVLCSAAVPILIEMFHQFIG